MDPAILVKLLNVIARDDDAVDRADVKLEQVMASARRRPGRPGAGGQLRAGPGGHARSARVFHADPMVSVGFLILASCPGAPVGPPMTAIARGDVALGPGDDADPGRALRCSRRPCSACCLPWVAPATALHVDYAGIVRTLLITQLLPLAVGLGFHHRAPG